MNNLVLEYFSLPVFFFQQKHSTEPQKDLTPSTTNSWKENNLWQKKSIKLSWCCHLTLITVFINPRTAPPQKNITPPSAPPKKKPQLRVAFHGGLFSGTDAGSRVVVFLVGFVRAIWIANLRPWLVVFVLPHRYIHHWNLMMKIDIYPKWWRQILLKGDTFLFFKAAIIFGIDSLNLGNRKAVGDDKACFQSSFDG